MFFVALAHDGQVLDDGYGMQTAPAYAVDEHGVRLELVPEHAMALTKEFIATLSQRGARSRLPLGDAVARVTKVVGIQPCTPCQARQQALNRFGDRIVSYWTPRS